MINKEHLEELAKKTIKKVLEENGPKRKPTIVEKVVKKSVEVIKEAVVMLPKTFLLKTEKLSAATKESHMRLYNQYIEAYNSVSSKLDPVNRETANSNEGLFRNLKVDEVYNRNAIILHEMFFDNISNLTSELNQSSLPYLRLSRDFGDFSNFQWDLIACCMASKNGWAATYYDPYKDKYFNCVIDGHATNVPVACMPVIVIDCFEHAYYKDYEEDKKEYVFNMMKELQWDLISARMTVAEKSNIKVLFQLQQVPVQEPTSNVFVSNELPVKPQENGIAVVNNNPSGTTLDLDKTTSTTQP